MTLDSFQFTGTCPRDRDLLNRVVRKETMAEAVPCNMLLEMPSGPDDVFLGMEDSSRRTSSLEQEILESSGGGGFKVGESQQTGFRSGLEKTLVN